MNVLGIFAKQPIVGQVKTRLAAQTSPEWAQQVAEAMLHDSLRRFNSVSAARVIAYAPCEARAYFERWAVETRHACFEQGEGDLGQRLQRFFQQQRTAGYQRIVVIGTDSPTLPISYVTDAFTQLQTHDVVVGPAMDGGYYLIGASNEKVALFDAIPWSTADVLTTTVQRVREAGAKLALLPPWYDVDTLADWAMLRGHVLAMRQAGIDVPPGIAALILGLE